PETVQRARTCIGVDHPVQRNRLYCFTIPTDDTWARDFGPICVQEERSPILLDFNFNGWGKRFSAELDNRATQELNRLNAFAAPVRRINWTLEGGAVDFDDRGRMLATKASVLNPNRNGYVALDEVERLFRQTFGVNEFLWLEHGHIPGDDTDSHIDTLARFVPGGKILYCRPEHKDHPAYSDLMLMEKEIFQHGERCGLEPVPLPLPMPLPHPIDHTPMPATYANFLFINDDVVLLPVYGLPEDEKACNVLRGVLPSYEIVPIDCRTLIRQHGSLHCMTMQLPRETFNRNCRISSS
ncbi:MAG: agmatine deiminase family protein, partial [Lentisphaerae bacterium]